MSDGYLWAGFFALLLGAIMLTSGFQAALVSGGVLTAYQIITMIAGALDIFFAGALFQKGFES